MKEVGKAVWEALSSEKARKLEAALIAMAVAAAWKALGLP